MERNFILIKVFKNDVSILLLKSPSSTENSFRLLYLDHTKKSSAADILSKGGSDPDLLGSGYEDKNNNKDKNLLEEKSSEGGEEQEEAKGRSGHDEDEKESEEEDDDDDEEVSSEVDDSDDEVISYDLESLHQDLDDDVTASYTVKLSSQISS